MLKFHIIIIKFSIFTNKNSQSDAFFLKLKNTIVKIDIKSFSVLKNLKNLKSFCGKKDVFDCAGIRAQVFQLLVQKFQT